MFNNAKFLSRHLGTIEMSRDYGGTLGIARTMRERWGHGKMTRGWKITSKKHQGFKLGGMLG
jgi:hypothetical protein